MMLHCSSDSRHGFFASAYPAMGRPPADPTRIIALFKAQPVNWHLEVMEIEPGILLGRGTLRQCRICGAGLIPVSPAIQAQAEAQHLAL